ncbi:TolC family protein [Singulisphaera acidiphila]|uniref:Outer membrane protein n=1 Tax=Singulisphaera acidiphila (strain ATCC BAA-1392 / DSM 18658 / VKM B-2454 / MOB10) TaxID=886293 RepID=L0DLK3_SINAD|nr:TolC family protein [Singulisphaera acidiphila]AGA30269.1 outer membrane protein [Singulisphaera acidiphila DSM 18658]
MLAPHRLILLATGAGLIACAATTRAQDALLPGPHRLTPPQVVYHLTLEDAKQRAITTNKGLELANLGIQANREATAAARADYLPKLLGNVNYFHFNSNLGVVQTIRTGRLGILPVGSRSIAVNAVNQDSSLAAITLAQPITKLIAINAAVKIAKADEQIGQAQLAKGTRDLLSGVAQAFYGLHGAQRIETALRLQVGYAQQLAQANPAPEIRVAAIEAKQALNQVHGQAVDIAEQLNNLIGLPAGTVLVLEEPMPPAPPVHSADEAASRALACNPQVQEAMASSQKAAAALQVARSEFLPDVNIFGSYFNQTAAPIIQPNFGAFGISASYTFVDWGKRRHIKYQREFQTAQAQRNVQATIDKVVLEARQAYGNFEQTNEALALASELVQARRDAEGATKSPLAIQTAKAATAKAELEQLHAEADYRVAHAKLMEVIGLL